MSKDMQIELTDDQLDCLVELFVRDKMSTESIELYDQLITQGHSVGSALKNAAVNESVIKALKLAIEMKRLES